MALTLMRNSLGVKCFIYRIISVQTFSKMELKNRRLFCCQACFSVSFADQFTISLFDTLKVKWTGCETAPSLHQLMLNDELLFLFFAWCCLCFFSNKLPHIVILLFSVSSAPCCVISSFSVFITSIVRPSLRCCCCSTSDPWISDCFLLSLLRPLCVYF